VEENYITERIIGAGINVHRALGPGLLESVYEDCLLIELKEQGILFKNQVGIPLQYKGYEIKHKLVLDIIVENKVIVELKACEKLIPVHDAQLLTYLKLTGCKVGLLMNFNVPVLKSGIKRIVYNL